jgi:superfamily II DNA/RNA helicase
VSWSFFHFFLSSWRCILTITFNPFSTIRNSKPQTILFSATFTDEVWKLAKKFAPDANEITLKREEVSVDNIKQFYMDCNSEQDKYQVLVSLYQILTVGQSIIFCQVCFYLLPFHTLLSF